MIQRCSSVTAAVRAIIFVIFRLLLFGSYLRSHIETINASEERAENRFETEIAILFLDFELRLASPSPLALLHCNE